jgi:hypothetical protein
VRHVHQARQRRASAAAGRDAYPANYPGFELEGWVSTGRGARVGFRCVAELAPADVPLTVPARRHRSRWSRSEGSLQLFGGVAEAVTQAEARRFCAELQVPELSTGAPLTGWRLPEQREVPGSSPGASADRARSGPRTARSRRSPRPRRARRTPRGSDLSPPDAAAAGPLRALDRLARRAARRDGPTTTDEARPRAACS